MTIRAPMRFAHRVALAYALGTTVVLAATGWAVDRVLAAQLAQRDIDEILGKLDQARHLVSEQADAVELTRAQHVFGDIVLGHEGTTLSISAPPGVRVVSVGGAEPIATPGPMPIVANGRAAVADDVVLTRDGTRGPWRIVQAEAELADGSPVTVRLARNVADSAALQTRFRGALAPLVLVAALATALYGWTVVSRGMAPLRRIAEAARRLGARHLDERLPEDRGPVEVRELAAAFNAMAARLEEGVARLSRFGDDLAHEFRTPLATLRAHTEVTLRQAHTEGELRALLHANLEDYERLARMVDEMLFLAQADDARIALQRQPLALDELVTRMAEFHEPLAQERDVSLCVEGAGRIVGDAALIERAIANLLSNAIRHAHAGSEVRITVWPAGERVKLSVRNRGDAIAAADLPRVFERFWRGDPARSGNVRSSGLGLAIVQSIARLHDAHAEVESDAGGMTEFRLLFPAAPLSLGSFGSSRGCA